MTEEQDKNIPSDELITALREEYEKKLKDREAELRKEFEEKQKEQEARHIRDMRALLSGHKEEQIDKSEDEEEKTYEQTLLEKITQKFIKERQFMAVQNNFAPGVDGLTYKPNNYAEVGGLIGKIA